MGRTGLDVLAARRPNRDLSPRRHQVGVRPMNDNRYIKFVATEYRVAPAARPRLGFSGALGLLIWAAVVLWLLR